MKPIRSGFPPLDRRRRHLTGFTLLELLIALVIVVILASMAIPSFSKAIEKTKVKDAQTTLAAIYSSEKIYRLDQGSYGTGPNLSNNNYISDPNTGNTTWDFSVVIPAPPANTFTATATRTGGSYDTQTITVTESFNSTNYGGTHALRDQ